jgi:hypothetical protein
MEIEKPPVFAKWRSWYFLVLFVLIVQVIFFFLLTNHFA